MTEGTATPSPDPLACLIAQAMAMRESNASPVKVRLQLLQDGADADTADLVVDRVFNDSDLPLSERYTESSRIAASQATSGSRMEEYSWLIWAGGLLLINVLSYALDWGFWIW